MTHKRYIKSSRKRPSATAFQIAIAGGDNPNGCRNLLIAADTAEAPHLENTQQSYLHVHGHLGHLVQEERSSVSTLEAAAVRTRGAGEAAALVTEQFAFDQILGKRPAIHGYKSLAAALRKLVDRLRNELLP
jgi:hypothetical protein